MGEPIPFLDSSSLLQSDYSRVPSVLSTFDAVLLACLRCLRIYSFVSVACSCDPTFIAYLHGLPIVRYLDWFFRLVWCLVLCFSHSLCTDSADGSSAGSCRCLAQCCRSGGVFPKYTVFIASLGISVIACGIFALAIIFLGCACGVAFSLRMPILRLDLRLRLLALWVFAADLITGCPCVCVCVCV